MAERPFAIRPPLRVHLEQAEIQPELDLLATVLRFEPAGDHLAWLVLPLVQEMRYIEIHERNMAVVARQVNVSAGEIRWGNPKLVIPGSFGHNTGA